MALIEQSSGMCASRMKLSMAKSAEKRLRPTPSGSGAGARRGSCQCRNPSDAWLPLASQPLQRCRACRSGLFGTSPWLCRRKELPGPSWTVCPKAYVQSALGPRLPCLKPRGADVMRFRTCFRTQNYQQEEAPTRFQGFCMSGGVAFSVRLLLEPGPPELPVHPPSTKSRLDH